MITENLQTSREYIGKMALYYIHAHGGIEEFVRLLDDTTRRHLHEWMLSPSVSSELRLAVLTVLDKTRNENREGSGSRR